MDDRNLIAVAEQAAATSKVKRGTLEGATILFEDGRVFLGSRLEYDDATLDQDAVSNALAAGRVEGAYRPFRVGVYAPVSEGLPEVAPIALRRLQEAGRPDLAIVMSSGAGERVAFSLSDLLATAGLA
ncbi:MAG: hypothetical protein COA70_09940 [Planctomycetota bacterium]|nr:MAG: hypothetical protein COA70_09940 [Planctomycetota bacterium]